jgi:DNA-binding MarR family transcriptional regulator
MASDGLKAGILPGLLGYRLRVAQQALFRDFAASVAELSPGRVGILLLIEANPGVTQSRLAQAVLLERSTMVGVLHVLKLKRRIQLHERRVASRLTPAEREQLLGLLEKLVG